jgi:thiol-disulfide isomerase/thioredoxin
MDREQKTRVILVASIALIGLLAFGWDRMPSPPGVPVTAAPPPMEVQALPAKPAPDLSLVTLEGQAFTLKDLRGKVVIVNFWATWCPPCIAEFPRLLSLLDQTGDRVVLVALSNDARREDIAPFLAKYAATQKRPLAHPQLRMVWDENHRVTQDVFQTLRYPESIIIDPQGRMVRKIVGGDFLWDSPETVAYLNGL